MASSILPRPAFALVLALCALASCFLSGTETVKAHGSHIYQPPASGPGASAPSPNLPVAMPRTKPGTPGGPSTPQNDPKGARTKRTTGAVTQTGSWEYWWARNRYRFLEFPDTPFALAPGQVFTPDNNPVKIMRAKREQLRTRSLEIFRPYLGHGSARLRQAAVLSLGRLNDEDSLEKMQKLLADGNLTVRDSAILALGLHGNAKARYSLMHLARGSRDGSRLIGQSLIPARMRSFAEISLAATRTLGSGPILQEIALDARCDDEIRALALEGLGLLGDDSSVRFLSDFITNTRHDYRLLSTALTSLGKTESESAHAAMLKMLGSKKTALRQSAALALGMISPAEERESLKRLFRCYSQAQEQTLKGFCLVSIGLIGGPDAIKNLRRVLSRGNNSDRPWAALGLGLALRSGSSEKAEAELLSRLTSSGNRSTRGAIAIALGLAGSDSATRVLTRMLDKGGDPSFQGYCALALGMIGDKSAAGQLKKALKDQDLPQVSTQAAMAHCLLDERDSLEDLERLLLTTNVEATKAMAARSLVYLGNWRVVERLLDRIESRKLDELTTLYCMDLVSRLVTGQKVPHFDRMAACSNMSCEYPIVADLLDFGI